MRLAFSRPAAHPPPVVGAGFIPPARPCPAANRADMESAPTKVCYNAGAAVSRSARRHPRFVGEGHGPPVDLAAAQGSRDDASIVPYRICGSVRLAFSRLAAPLCSGRAFAGIQKGGPPFAGGPSFCNNWKRRSFCALSRALIPQSRDSCARPCRGGPCRRQRRRGPGGWRKPQGRPGSRSWNPA